MVNEYEWIDKLLRNGRVVLIVSDFEIPLKKIINAWEPKLLTEKIVLLSTAQKPDELDACYYRKISKVEEERLLNLYGIYDFSNEFFVLSRRQCCGSFMNLIEAGCISLEEALRAWLHR